jgi:Flp pilus assembly protein TadG
VRVSRRRASADSQYGIAAIEFSFVFMALFFLLYGIATFGAVFYTQQVISRAAEDGARAASLLSSALPLAPNDSRIRAAVYDSLVSSLVIPSSTGAASVNKRNWIVANTTVAIAVSGTSGTGASKTAVVSVSYLYSANRLLPSLPVLDTSRWMPASLVSRATVAGPS